MCLGIPGRVTEVWQEDGAPMAHADFAGTVRKICTVYLPDLTVGEFVISHMGYALTRMDAVDAAATISMMREYGVLAPARPAPGAAGSGSVP